MIQHIYFLYNQIKVSSWESFKSDGQCVIFITDKKSFVTSSFCVTYIWFLRLF